MPRQQHDPPDLDVAAAICGGRGAQMTALRRVVLDALCQAGRPLGAYELLSQLQTRLGRKLTPPTVYRALEFLLGHGLIARIESRNAYVPCAHPERPHGCVFFVCDQCSTSVEIENPELEVLMQKDARMLGFQIARRVVELQGTCATCRSAPVGPAPPAR
ncbi:MAG: Fur family transcriptional regulator [Reyranellaceae bacterium]